MKNNRYSTPMSLHVWHQLVIRGDPVAVGGGTRAVLLQLSRLYGAGVSLRNRWYDRGHEQRLPVPVISVGNITAGGTGKTPVVIDLAARLVSRGLRPAVVSRGYRAGSDGRNDEQAIIERRCPGVISIGDADRVRGGTVAVQRDRANVIILDDGFQHRRLHRDLDIVVIDATCPFGHDHLLPCGLLREPPESLSRADLVILSRSDQVGAADLEQMECRIAALAPSAPIVRARHAVCGVVGLDAYEPGRAGAAHDHRVYCAPGSEPRASARAEAPLEECPQFAQGDIPGAPTPHPPSADAGASIVARHARAGGPVECGRQTLAQRRVVCFAGIGNPAAFRKTVESLGARVVGEAWWPDHHHYLPSDVSDLLRPERFPEFDHLVTTEKDAVKLAGLAPLAKQRLRVVQIAIRFDGSGEQTVENLIFRWNPSAG